MAYQDKTPANTRLDERNHGGKSVSVKLKPQT